MVKKTIFLVIFLFSQITWAQQAAETTGGFGPRKQIATIVYMGLAGAVLGLSTLSFYGRPQDHLTNIAIGFGAGVIIGTVYMTYQAATNPSDFYNSQFEIEEERDQISHLFVPAQRQPLKLSYEWTF